MKRKYFKDGNPEIFNFFTDLELKDFTAKDKARWTPYSEAELAPIPEEVIKFNEAQEKPCCKDDKCKNLEAELDKLRAKIAESEITENVEELSEDIEDRESVITNEVIETEPTDEDIKDNLIEECRSKGLKVTKNMKIETLEKKLADAND